LDTDAKNAEILRLLPLMAPFTIDFTSMQQALDTAVTRLEQVQVRRDSNLCTSSFSVENQMCLYCVGNFRPAMGARNQVGIRLSYRPASPSNLASQFQTRFLELIHRPIAGLKFSTLFFQLAQKRSKLRQMGNTYSIDSPRSSLCYSGFNLFTVAGWKYTDVRE
jgi:hypothetical protein